METRDKIRQQLTAKIIEKAMHDAAFRSRLLNNPKETVEIETGVRLPADLTITALEEHPGKIYVVLPAIGIAVTEESEELTEVDLNRVEGGGPESLVTGNWTCADSGWF